MRQITDFVGGAASSLAAGIRHFLQPEAREERVDFQPVDTRYCDVFEGVRTGNQPSGAARCSYESGKRQVGEFIQREGETLRRLGDDLSLKTENRTLAFIHPEQTVPPRPTVLLHHGFSAGSTQWNTPVSGTSKATDEYAKVLFERGYNVLVPRLLGHGIVKNQRDDVRFLATASGSPANWANHADETYELAQALNGPVIVGGLSTGGALALLTAQRHPDVAAVLAVSPFIRPTNRGWQYELADKIPFGSQLLDQLPTTMPGSDPANHDLAKPYGFSRLTMGNALGLYRMGTQILEDAAKLKDRDVRVIYSKADDLASPDGTEKLIDKMTDAGALPEVRQFNDVNHAMISSRENSNDVSLVVLRNWMDEFIDGARTRLGAEAKDVKSA